MSGQDIQQLLLTVNATTELMRRELAKAAAETDQWATRTESAVNKASGSFDTVAGAANFAKGAIGGFIASISIGTLVQAGKSVLDFADDLDAAAEKAGLTAERYQTLKEGLRALEVDGDKADAAFQRLQDTLGAVQGGTAAAGVIAALDKMGVTSRILNGEITDTGGLFDAIAGSAGNFKTQAEFVAAVVDVVGRKIGIDLATAIKDGGVALGELEGGFRASGNVISKEYIQRLAAANEALAVFVRDSKASLTIWAGDFLTQLRGTMRIAEQEGLLALFTGDLTGDYVRAAGTDQGRLKQLKDQVLSARLLVNNSKTVAAQGGIGAMFGAGSAPELAQREANLRAAEARLAAFQATLPKTTPAGGGGGAITDPMITVTAKRLGAAAPRAAARAAALTPAQLRAGFGDKMSDLASPGLSIDDAALVSLDAFAKGGRVPGAMAPIDTLVSRLQEIKAITADLSKAQIIDPEQVALANKFSSDLSRGLGQAIIYGQNIGDALVNSIQAAAAELVSSQLLKLLGGENGSGGVLGTIATGFGALFGGGRAAGGPVQAGTPYLVGEHRPEIFVPSTRGRIVPRVGGGSGGMVQNFDLRGAFVTEDVMAQINSKAAQAAQAGALGGRAMAADDMARRARRRL